MIRIFDSALLPLGEVLKRGGAEQNQEIEETVAEIIRQVRDQGDQALRAYTARFDRVDLTELQVSAEEIQAAWESREPSFREILNQAAENIRDFHCRQLRTDIVYTRPDGVLLGQRFLPISRVGIYVPGGAAAYPSSVLMNAIPARLAGCERIVMVTPPGPEGRVNPDILAAAGAAGVGEIYRVGGAQAVAALAYGTETLPQVDKIVGPGNIYVATAKRQVFGQVAIDMIAGPSEILIIADNTANPRYVAADLLSQAEHDPLAAPVLITTERGLAEQVARELEQQLAELPRAEIARRALQGQGKIILAPYLEQAIALANRLAPEHLELCVADPLALLPLVKNAGSIFLGHDTPEALGDYWAGPNHVLPTAGTARFSSPLSVDDFIKRSSYLRFSKEALTAAAPAVTAFAEREGLEAHAASVRLRLEDQDRSVR